MTSPRCNDCNAPAVVELLMTEGEPFPEPMFVCEKGWRATALPYRKLGLGDLIGSSESREARDTGTTPRAPSARASLAAGPIAVAGIPVPVTPPRGSGRRLTAKAG